MLQQTESDEKRPESPPERHRMARFLTLLYTVGVLAFAYLGHRHDLRLDYAAPDLEELPALAHWLDSVLWIGLVDTLLVFPFGALLPLCVTCPAKWRGRFGQILLFVPVGILFSLAVWTIELGTLPAISHLSLPMTGFFAGLWIGTTWRRGWRARLWFFPKAALAALLLLGGLLWCVQQSLENTPLAIESIPVRGSTKRLLMKAVKDSAEDDIDATRRLVLEQDEVTAVLGAALSRVVPEARVDVRFQQDFVAGAISVPLPSTERYVNVQVDCRLGVNSGELQLEVQRLRIGKLRIPRPFLAFLSPTVTSVIADEPDLRQVVHLVELLRIQPEKAEIVLQPGRFSRVVLPALLTRMGGKPDVLSETQEYYQHLVTIAPQLPAGDPRFGAFMQEAFRLAKKRSVLNDPAVENRAAIFALAILLGHEKIEGFIGPVTEPTAAPAAARAKGRVTLRGRTDLTQHFFVSAALVLAGSEEFSNRVGRLKEELDSDGGSGFSFVDLMADRSGTLFALTATHDPDSARAMQERLAAGFRVEEFFPPFDGLREGMTQEELFRQYGGVGGAGYQQVVDDIEQRLASCKAFR